MNSPAPPDIVGLMVALLAMLTSDAVAQQLGPYMAIVLVAVGGSMIALMGRDDTLPIPRAALFVAVRVLLAITLTVSVAQLVARVWPTAEVRYSLVPIALFIGWVKDYNAVLTWCGQRIAALIGRKTDNA